MTDIVPTPPAPFVPQYPALGSSTFNQEAYTYGSTMPSVTAGIRDMAVSSETNARASKEFAEISQASANESERFKNNAEAAATAAAAAVNATEWNATTLYERGAAVWSPSNFLTYRRTIAGSGGDDPASDSSGVWEQIGGLAEILRPDVLLPADGAVDVMDGPIFELSDYFSLYDIPLAATRVQASTNPSFTSVFWDSGDVASGTPAKMPSGIMNTSTTYYWRGQYVDIVENRSGWAAGSFTTATQFANYIPTPAPTPSNFGDPFDGGFYAGMIWNQIAQSGDLKTLATGVTVFTVPDMSVNPIVYGGQQIEIRSRANPNNHFKCIVNGAIGTELSVSVTEISGTGTFSDWSVMSRFRVIVAPKSSGESAILPLKISATSLPAECNSLSEGFIATSAMVSAGNSDAYPAAHWSRSLNIGGYSDWCVPARDQFELIYRNLKPTSEANQTQRSSDATISGRIIGGYADASPAANGLNLNSSPRGSEYSASNPTQTPSIHFRSGGTEHLYGPYWTSSAATTDSSWVSYANNGSQNYTGNNQTHRIRAIRRSII